MSRTRSVGWTLLHLFAFLLWNFAYAATLFLIAPPGGVVAAVGVTALYVVGLLRSVRSRVYRLPLVDPPRATWRWLALAVPLFLILSAALDSVYGGLVSVPQDVYNPFANNPLGDFDLLDTSLGRLSFAAAGVAVAPLVEELVFRGLLQGALVRRWGTTAGLVTASTLFALAHGFLTAFPIYFFLGMGFGFVTLATRSIWAGVTLHAANNALAYASSLLLPGAGARPTLRETGFTAGWWIAVAVLLMAAAAAVWTARRLWDAGAEGRLRPSSCSDVDPDLPAPRSAASLTP